MSFSPLALRAYIPNDGLWTMEFGLCPMPYALCPMSFSPLVLRPYIPDDGLWTMSMPYALYALCPMYYLVFSNC